MYKIIDLGIAAQTDNNEAGTFLSLTVGGRIRFAGTLVRLPVRLSSPHIASTNVQT